MATHIESERRTWEPPTAFANKTVKWIVYAVIVVFFLWSAWGVRISFDRLLIGLESGLNLIRSMIPPNFGPRQLNLIRIGMIETVAMAIVATVVGVVISLPVAFMAAENIAPKPVYAVGRFIISVSRAFHELIVAIVAVKAVGFGALAGILALSFKTVGFFAKLLAEDLEDIDEGQIEAIRAVGGSRGKVLLYGMIPQVIPRIVGLTIYRWDINIRHSTIVGIVGAGGIGITLLNAFDRYEYDFALAVIIVIVAIVLGAEVLSAVLRRRVQ